MSTDQPAGALRRRLILSAQSSPRLAPHAKLRFDDRQSRWIILVPEKILHPSETAVEVLKLCNGERSIEDIASTLAQEYDAPRQTILAETLPVLQELADNGFLIA